MTNRLANETDSIYMQAVQLMNGNGSWPMSVFLIPDGKPFYAWTYFPPDDCHGKPGFPKVIVHVSEAYRQRRDEVDRARTRARRTNAARSGGIYPFSEENRIDGRREA